ncbi:PREDICTED: uncharacterized protein LOC105559300 [Vollenhovia emeryi]|uniref:uncharacterized protein LOC105559300 n=1 Tax=Vollenhovia emeryi TaxID=411798 RepID=UPI0005F3E8E3|nr:PREDICTED: uncharacterized protein LOC105559300 [Vollenhovia emeryi]
MHNNVEIKAVIRDVERTVARAKELSDAPQTIIEQHDIFFKTDEGRLKLRKFKDGTGQLISYKRPDVTGPKLSTYELVEINPDMVKLVTENLSRSNGVLGVVKKTRLLFKVGQTRIHIDQVDGLGSYLELEVVMQQGQDVEAAQKIANDLMQALFVKGEDLIAQAYIDLLNSKE